jgi:hypothetical protein
MNETELLTTTPQWLKDAYDFVERHSVASIAQVEPISEVESSSIFCANPACTGGNHLDCSMASQPATTAPAAKPKFPPGVVAAQRAGYCITTEAELMYLRQTEKARLTFEAQRLYPGQSRLQKLTVKKLLHVHGLGEALTSSEARELRVRNQSQPMSDIEEALSASR